MIHTSYISLQCLADAQLGGVRLCRAQVGSWSLLRGHTALGLLSRGRLRAAHHFCWWRSRREAGCKIGLWSGQLIGAQVQLVVSWDIT